VRVRRLRLSEREAKIRTSALRAIGDSTDQICSVSISQEDSEIVSLVFTKPSIFPGFE
jgi:hypothetical protein